MRGYYKFLEDHKHTVKFFRKGSICQLHWQFGNELLKEKIVTDKLSRREIKNIEKQKEGETKDGK